MILTAIPIPLLMQDVDVVMFVLRNVNVGIVSHTWQIFLAIMYKDDIFCGKTLKIHIM